MITKLSISMPKSLEEYARSRVARGGYGSISEYFRELVRLDQRFELAKRENDLRQHSVAVRPDEYRNRLR